MKTHWKILIAVGIVLLLLAGSMIFSLHTRPANAVEAYKKLLLARGEKLKLSEVWPPPVPAESNSLDAVEEAFGLIGSGTEQIPYAMKTVVPGKALAGWAQPQARGDDFTNSWDELAAEVAANRPAIELLKQILEKPTLNFDLDYRKGAALPLPHLAYFKRASQMLDAAASCNLHYGDTGAATTNILTMLGIVRKNESEALLISHLVRIAIVAIAVPPTWELLQHTNDTDAQLSALQESWEQMDVLGDAENAFVTERVWMMNEIEKLRASPGELQELVGSLAISRAPASSTGWGGLIEKPRSLIGEVMWRSSWSYSDELRALKGDTIIIDALRTMQTNRSQFYMANYDAIQSKLAAIGITNTGEAFFHALNIPDFSEIFGNLGMSSVVSRDLRIEAARRVVVTAIALKRFQLRNGHWPQTLNDLVPQFLTSVPIDPYDGKPLRYHPNADGTFLLYSVGEDGKDDGGNPKPAAHSASSDWLRGRDWVWPQPASREEVKAYEHSLEKD